MEFTPENKARFEEIVARYPVKRSALLPALHLLQRQEGWLTPEANQALSVKRAEAVKAYLVAKGADPDMLIVAGAGAKELKNSSNPTAAENRRVEIGRQNAP